MQAAEAIKHSDIQYLVKHHYIDRDIVISPDILSMLIKDPITLKYLTEFYLVNNYIVISPIKLAIAMKNPKSIKNLIINNASIQGVKYSDLEPYISLDEMVDIYLKYGIRRGDKPILINYIIEAYRYDLFRKLSELISFGTIISDINYHFPNLFPLFIRMVFEFGTKEERNKLIEYLSPKGAEGIDMIINNAIKLTLEEKLSILTHMIQIFHGAIQYDKDTSEISCDNILYYIDIFNLDREETLNYLQGMTPRPLCGIYGRYYSGRGRVVPKQVRALGEFSYQSRDKSIPVFSEFLKTEQCYCLQTRSGFYESVYIPVIRYGKGPTHGYYGGSEKSSHDFTWFYIEPESGIYLYAPQVLVAKNKITAVLILMDSLNIRDEDILDRIYELFPVSIENLRGKLLSDELIMLDKERDNFLMSKGINVMFKGGLLDFLDSYITNYARQLNIDVVVLTHQPGTGERLVSECVDTRPREITIQNLYQD